MQTFENFLSFLVTNLPSAIFAVIGYLLGHYLSCVRSSKGKKCEFIIDEFNKLQEIVDKSFNEIVSSAENKDGNFVKIVLNKQRLMNRKIEFVIKILKKYHVKSDNLRKNYNEIREFLTGDEFSITVSEKIDKQKLSQLVTKLISEIDDLKWETICKF